jgi:hypothetical protein
MGIRDPEKINIALGGEINLAFNHWRKRMVEKGNVTSICQKSERGVWKQSHSVNQVPPSGS